MDIGSMKVNTRLFNEEFLMAQANLEGVGSNPGFDAKPTRQMSMDQADAEDARLNRMRII